MSKSLILAAVLAAAHIPAPALELTAPEVIGLHVATYHDKPGYCSFNPGGYARWTNGLTLGAYHNSDCRLSVYGGWTWTWNYFSLTMGAVAGYERAAVLPLVVPSVALPITQEWTARIAFIPKIEKSGANAVHFMFERRF